MERKPHYNRPTQRFTGIKPRSNSGIKKPVLRRGRSVGRSDAADGNGNVSSSLLKRGKSMPGKLARLFHSQQNLREGVAPTTTAAASAKRSQTKSRSRSTGSRRSLSSKHSTNSKNSSQKRRSTSGSSNKQQHGKQKVSDEIKRGAKSSGGGNAKSSSNINITSKGRKSTTEKIKKTHSRHTSLGGVTKQRQSRPVPPNRPNTSKRKGDVNRKDPPHTRRNSSANVNHNRAHVNHNNNKLPLKKKPRSKSMPPLSTPFRFNTIYPQDISSTNPPVSPLPSIDSSWRYNAKLERLKEELKRERLKHFNKQSRGGRRRDRVVESEDQSLDSYYQVRHKRFDNSKKKNRREVKRGRPRHDNMQHESEMRRHHQQQQRNSPPKMSQRSQQFKDSSRQSSSNRYRSKSADSIFEQHRKKDEYNDNVSQCNEDVIHSSALVPYGSNLGHYGDDDFDYEKYDNNDFWEEELYNNNHSEREYHEEEDGVLATKSLTSLHSTPTSPDQYGPSLDMSRGEFDKSKDWNYYGDAHDPVCSLHGSSAFSWNKSVDDSGLAVQEESEEGSAGKASAAVKVTKKSKHRGGQRHNSSEFDMSLSVNDLEEKSTNSGSGSSASTSGRNNQSTSITSFIVPPLHSEVRANMPSSAIAPKPSKKALVRSAVAHATAVREEMIEASSANQSELSDITLPTVFAPPPHSEVRAKRPSKKKVGSVAGNSNSGSDTNCSIDLVSEVTMPSTLKSVVRAPPLLSEVLKRKPTNNMSGASLGEESSGMMSEPKQDNYRQQPQQTMRNTKEFTPRPPPPPPPPRIRPSKQSTPSSSNPKPPRRPTHPTAGNSDNLEDIGNSLFSRHLPPLKEEVADSATPPTANKQESGVNYEVVQLNNAAAQLLLMQSTGKSPVTTKSPVVVNKPNVRDLARNATLPFENFSRTASQPTANSGSPPSALLRRSTHSGLMNPGNVASRNRKVEQMPFTDEFGDAGLYTGEVNEDCRPNGQGKMKYDNGVFLEGKWNNGAREGNTIAQRERMLSGFTSWKGAGMKGGGSSTAHGMSWIDRFGKAGQYSGDVNEHNVPHGKGVLKYDFGLIAEGTWVNGILIDGSKQPPSMGGGMAFAGQTIVGGGPGNGSFFPGMTATVVPGMGIGMPSAAFPTQPPMMMGNNLNTNANGMGNVMYGNASVGQSGPPAFIRKID